MLLAHASMTLSYGGGVSPVIVFYVFLRFFGRCGVSSSLFGRPHLKSWRAVVSSSIATWCIADWWISLLFLCSRFRVSVIHATAVRSAQAFCGSSALCWRRRMASAIIPIGHPASPNSMVVSIRLLNHAPLDPQDLPEVLLARGLSISISSRP
eukprot:SAG11_NODE_7783_length_1096_cov_4.895687_1_plen_153_part_00